MRVGLFDHFGWAITVTVTGDGTVVDRRRVALVEPGVTPAPIHYDGKELGAQGVAELLPRVRASVTRASAAALDELTVASPEPISALFLRTWPADFPTDVETQLRSPYEARADAILYREILAEVAEARGWAVHTYEVKAVLAAIDDAILAAPRATLGAPWTKDHRIALAAVLASA